MAGCISSRLLLLSIVDPRRAHRGEVAGSEVPVGGERVAFIERRLPGRPGAATRR